MKKISVLAVAIFLGFTLAKASVALATLTTFTTAGCAGFEACSNAAFDAIVNPPDVFISFSSPDKNGNPLPPAGAINGGLFSNAVTFSTAASGFGAASPNIQYSGDGSASEIGPTPGFNGILRIDFASAVSAVGFGTVELETNEFIRIYDQSLALIGTFNDPSNSVFDYFGVIASGGQSIGRIELDGVFYAIQDIKFDLAAVTAVPEPSSLLLLSSGLLGIVTVLRRR